MSYFFLYKRAKSVYPLEVYATFLGKSKLVVSLCDQNMFFSWSMKSDICIYTKHKIFNTCVCICSMQKRLCYKNDLTAVKMKMTRLIYLLEKPLQAKLAVSPLYIYGNVQPTAKSLSDIRQRHYWLVC